MPIDDDRLLAYWAEWSEEIYCAGFMFSDDHPTMARFVTEFRVWVSPKLPPYPSYPKLRNNAELAFLQEYKFQDGLDRGIARANERFEKDPERYG